MPKKNIITRTHTYVGLIRGINVSGHHKVPMIELKNLLHELGLVNVRTILNSGNVIFESKLDVSLLELEMKVQETLENHFGFRTPTILVEKSVINHLVTKAPFKNISVSKDIRLYVTFIKEKSKVNISTPWISVDGGFKILHYDHSMILSILDLSISRTAEGMTSLEKIFGKNITTRNWNTFLKIHAKL